MWLSIFLLSGLCFVIFNLTANTFHSIIVQRAASKGILPHNDSSSLESISMIKLRHIVQFISILDSYWSCHSMYNLFYGKTTHFSITVTYFNLFLWNFLTSIIFCI